MIEKKAEPHQLPAMVPKDTVILLPLSVRDAHVILRALGQSVEEGDRDATVYISGRLLNLLHPAK